MLDKQSDADLKSINKQLKDTFGDACDKITNADLKSAKQLQKDGEKADAIMRPYLEDIARRLGLAPQASVTELNVKSLTRIFEKAHSKYSGDTASIPDIARCRLLIESPDDVIKLRNMFVDRRGKILSQYATNEITVNGFQDNYYEPSDTGRIGINLTFSIRLSDTRRIGYEVQIIHKDMQDVEQTTHNVYEKACAIERLAKLENRPLTQNEEKAIEAFNESNIKYYLASAYELDLYKLRHPRFQQEKQEHLHAAANDDKSPVLDYAAL